MNELDLKTQTGLVVRQRYEIAEFLGFETRNRYEILADGGQVVAYAAEQQKGFLGFLFRQFLGHWRRFDILFFTPHRQAFLRGHHPFRFFFQRMEIFDAQNMKLGALQSRFAILRKNFDVEDNHGRVFLRVRSPFFRFWKFEFERQGRIVATVSKKWSGILTEMFTDKDNFRLEFHDSSLTNPERQVIMAAALFIDLQYFEHKAD